VEYGKIVSDAFGYAWRHKSLWIFGVFAAGGGSYNVDFSWGEEMAVAAPSDAAAFLERFGPMILAFAALGALMLLISMIFTPALIDAANRLARGGVYTFGQSFSRGVDFFWRFLGLTALWILTGIGFGIVVLMLSIVPFFIIVAIPVGFAGFFLLLMAAMIGQRALVVRDISIADAYEEGFKLVLGNIGSCVGMALLTIGLGILMAIILLPAGYILYYPFNHAAATLADDPVSRMILTMLFGLPVSLVIAGFTGAAMTNLFTLFYFGLVDPNTLYGRKSSTQPGAMI